MNKIEVGTQNVSHFTNLNNTGEISSKMIRESGAKYFIVGHSERRIFFNESNKQINIKIMPGYGKKSPMKMGHKKSPIKMGHKKSPAMMKKGSAMMKKGSAMMKKGSAMLKKGTAMYKKHKK